MKKDKFFIIIKNRTYTTTLEEAIQVGKYLIEDTNGRSNQEIVVNNSKYGLDDVSCVVLRDIVVTRRQIINKDSTNFEELVFLLLKKDSIEEF